MSAPGHSDRLHRAQSTSGLPREPEIRGVSGTDNPLAKATGPTFWDARLLLLFHS